MDPPARTEAVGDDEGTKEGESGPQTDPQSGGKNNNVGTSSSLESPPGVSREDKDNNDAIVVSDHEDETGSTTRPRMFGIF